MNWFDFGLMRASTSLVRKHLVSGLAVKGKPGMVYGVRLLLTRIDGFDSIRKLILVRQSP